jgi:hypothetical protein
MVSLAGRWFMRLSEIKTSKAPTRMSGWGLFGLSAGDEPAVE